jgi:hypothetical protein
MLNSLSDFTMATTELLSAPVAVPSDYLGFHFHRYPSDPAPVNGVSTPSPTPTFNYGAVRTHDNGRCQWGQLNPSNGTYYWTKMDEFVDAFPGKTITFTLYGTPTWAAKPADATHTGPYNSLGECGMPAQMSYVTTFLNELFTRYGNKITNFEIWNEPFFTENYTGFWWGSVQDLLLLSKTCYDWIKTNRPSVNVISPGFTHGLADKVTETPAYTWCNTVLAGQAKGHTYCDAIAFHPYTMFYTGTANSRGWLNTYNDMRFNAVDCILDLPAYLGITKPLTITEWGVDSAVGGTKITEYTKLSPSEQAVLTWRTLAFCAIKQVKSFYIYGYDVPLSGNWCNHQGRIRNDALCNMVSDFNLKISGKTISSASRFHDGRLLVTMSTGEKYCY